MSQKERRAFEYKLIFHAAPTLLGIKCGGLFSLPEEQPAISENLDFFNCHAASKGLKTMILRNDKSRILILVYNEQMLKRRLCEIEVRDVLGHCGYTDFTVAGCLERLSERLKASAVFPHEIGIFLGYPTEDVIGFIENKGGNFKLCGVWKVYGDTQKAERAFLNYEKCRKFLCDKFNEGADLYRVLRIS